MERQSFFNGGEVVATGGERLCSGAGLAGLFGGGVGGAAAVHGLAEEGVDAGLVAGAGALEPGEDVGVEADGDGAFDGAIEFADDGLATVRDFGDVGGIDVLIAETDEGFELWIRGFGASARRFPVRGAWPFALR
jgi:hypothetical protein